MTSSPRVLSGSAGAGWRELLADRNASWLLGGSLVSMLGDAFSMLALPLLVLQNTNDPSALGLAMALTALPRAALLLAGGGIVDRYSARTVLVLSRTANAALLITLATAVNLGYAGAAWIYACSFLLGVSSAFGYPAGAAIVTDAIAPRLLSSVNAALLSARQLTTLGGTLAAGLLLTHSISDVGGGGREEPNATGLALAFMLDGISFACSAMMLTQLRIERRRTGPARSMVADVRSSWGFWRADPLLRPLFIYLALISLVMGSAIQIGLPLLSTTLRASSELTLAAFLSAQCLGFVIGLHTPTGLQPSWSVGRKMLVIDAMVGIALIALGHAAAWWHGVITLLLVGFMSGRVQINVQAVLQRQIPKEMMGRLMSILMLIILGTAPLGSLLAGTLAQHQGVHLLFESAGVCMLVATAIGFMSTSLRDIS